MKKIKQSKEQSDGRGIELGSWNCQAEFEQRPQQTFQGSFPEERQKVRARVSSC